MNVFIKCDPNIMVQLSTGEVIPLEDLVKRHEDLVKRYKDLVKRFDKKSETRYEEAGVRKPQKLEVGVWFLIDRKVIESRMSDFEKACKRRGTSGVEFFNRCQASLKKAKEKPEYYTQKIETYIFEMTWVYKTNQQLRTICEEKGDGQTDEIIADLELIMRFCNGETINELIQKPDTLPRIRVITLTNGGTGSLGGGVGICSYPPAHLYRYEFNPDHKLYAFTTSAFRRVL